MAKEKGLNTFGVFSLGAGAMISSGLFILPAIAFSEAGSGVLFSYFLAGLCMIPAVFTKLELTSAMPKSGGAFFPLTRIFGAPVGLIAGFTDWFSVALKSAFALVGIGIFGSLLFPSFGEPEFRIIAVIACLFFTVLNLVSAEGSGRFQVFMVFFLFLILVIYLLVGYRHMEFGHFSNISHTDWIAVVRTAGMVFISYGGITKIAAAVEEIRNPKKMLVPGLLSAFFVTQVFYLLVVFVTIGAMDAGTLVSSYSPLTDAAQRFFTDNILSVIAVLSVASAGMLAFFTTANAGILSASRIPMAMSRDGFLPERFGRVNKRGIPVFSVIITSAFMMLIILGLPVKELARVASLFLLLVFLLENLGLIVIRFSKLGHYRPIFSSPLFPALQISGIVVYGILIAGQGVVPLLIAGGFVAAGIAWYFIYARKSWSKTSAFVSMIRRLFGPGDRPDDAGLEDELLGILMERQEIQEDWFDRIVRNAAVIDYQKTVNRNILFRDAARILGKKYRISSTKLYRKFLEREELSSTLIYPGVAVPHALPHVIIEGEAIFDIVLVRARFGITWTGNEVVYTAFCLAGSRDQRNVHLRALMSIAQTLQDPSFHIAWHKARNEKELKSALLLSHRKRITE